MNNTINLQTTSFKTSLNVSQIYKAIEKGLDYIFLDSSKKDSHYSKYSIIGANPFLTIKYENKIIYQKKHEKENADFVPIKEVDIFQYLKKILDRYSIENNTSLPFIGGGIGYFSYDLSKELENLPDNAQSLVHIPDCYFVFYDNVVLLDLASTRVTITGLSILKDANESVKALKLKIEEYENSHLPNNISPMTDASTNKDNPIFQSHYTSKSYMDAVNRMRQYIEDGHIYIANMTHTYCSKFMANPLDTYDTLRHVNPAPFSAYLPLDGFEILSSSPERFLEIRDSVVTTSPIKGTRPRGNTPNEDDDNKQQLMNSEKDKSELLMIVDLERNDLSKVCIPGSVEVTELFKIETYATVFHLVSTVIGVLKDNQSAVDCIKATFPGGSITGAPKVRAMEIIDELELTKRGLYTGCIGYLGFDGNADFNIVIRTILIKDNMAYIGVGGGITWESDVEAEYQETMDKAKALFKSLSAEYIDDLSNDYKIPSVKDINFLDHRSESYIKVNNGNNDGINYGIGFFETILVSDKGKPIFAIEHVNRINKSLETFNIPIRLTCQVISDIIKTYDIHNEALKIIVSDENLIVSRRPISYTEDYYKRGVSLTLSPMIRSSHSFMVQHKSINYGDMILSLRKARTDGYGDCLFTNENGYITETSIANVYIIKNNRIVTPPITDGLLPGVVRHFMINTFDVIVDHFTVEDVISAQGVFLTNSLFGIVNVTSFNGGTIPIHPLQEQLSETYFRYISTQ